MPNHVSQTLTQAEAELSFKQGALRGCLNAIRSATSVEEAVESMGHYFDTQKDIRILTAKIAFAKAFGEGSNG